MSTESKRAVRIPVDSTFLDGDLVMPADTRGIVVFAHGSGSSRLSPRNRFVAETIRKRNIGTLLFDLLTADEERIDYYTRHLRFDIEMLATRLVAAIRWLRSTPEGNGQPIGLFGASTGAAAALVAAAKLEESVATVVSRGGRPDLAGAHLGKVACPVLLIVGGYDDVVITLNEEAMKRLKCPKKLEIIPRATHLFEEPGALGDVAEMAAAWFESHLAIDHASTAVCR